MRYTVKGTWFTAERKSGEGTMGKNEGLGTNCAPRVNENGPPFLRQLL